MIYALLYNLVMPTRCHDQEIFFDYGNHAQLVRDYDRKLNLTLPTADLNLLEPHRHWKTHEEIGPKTASLLVAGVRYDLFVELHVPESFVNYKIGMFMVYTHVQTAGGDMTLASSARPVIVREINSLIRLVQRGVWFLPHLLSLSEPTQRLWVPVMIGYEESKKSPMTNVKIVLNHPEIQIYSAKLTIIAQLTGIPYLMYHWSVATAFLFILNIAFFEGLLILVVYGLYNLPNSDSYEVEKNCGGDIEEVGYIHGIKEETLSRVEVEDMLYETDALYATDSVEHAQNMEPKVEKNIVATAFECDGKIEN
uniref:Uncharacterized protein AlNc14C39G3349 n=1 Tax=Albugo laibachii Nc14 TaxID=890382 RepID=F0W982_9STRA|nr:conserved hypothetical protein [Albugo laibachii Nc14]CCA18341.1 conserved hypothetical protein [Albugo laibachii Nc14]|eukprot:CCA18341.1 conserved hypothetical protein [Albugo laibachii Nc14]